ncbi:MAG: hypothetical protein GVX78_01965 [Bacteroidetes bacterium]|jgi:erythromycin esterase|nr:hypothetical protein [Bacteroidota bacterium]
MDKVLPFIFLLWAAAASAQSEKLDSISPEIIQLCKQLGPTKKIIGLGESTHGTKEFTIIRSDIVKTLIETYDYRVFVLEAEYLPCAKINEYLRRGQGDPQALLQDVLLWPWINKDFLELIHWMRNYNINNPSDQVYFLGMDSQLSKLYATKDSIRKHYPAQHHSIFKIVESDDKPKRKIKKLRRLSRTIRSKSATVDMRIHYYILCRINRLANSDHRDVDARDENMAYLIDLIQQKYEQKIVLWSHNGHIWKKKPSLSHRTPAGYHLEQTFNTDYAAVGLDVKRGRFHAVSYDKDDRNEIKVFDLKPIESTLSMEVDHQNKRMVVIDCSTMKGKKYINAIGAIYVSNPQKGDAFISKIKEDKQFDYIISIPNSSPTQLLGR